MNAARMRALLLVLLAAGSIAAPFAGIETDAKSSECIKKTRFQPGKEYTYSYVGETVSAVNGSSEERSALKIVARCIIQTVGNCTHVLKINNAELWEAQSKTLSPRDYRVSEGSAKFARELAAHELHFHTKNGAITGVSPNASEPVHVLNIKKGILSALQVQLVNKKTARLEETDVAGKCKVSYQVHKNHITGRAKVVSKSRNLTDCSERSKTDLGIHIHHYNEKAISLLSCKSNCRYLLSDKLRVQKVTCEEEHVFRPFSAGHQHTAGAMTTTKQVLVLQSVKKMEVIPRFPQGLNIMPLSYNHSREDSADKDYNTAIKIMTQLVRESMEETKPESARLFSRLVFSLRKLTEKAMTVVWDEVFDCDKSGLCKPEEKNRFQMYLLDALPHCGSSGCAKVMMNAIKNELVSGERGNMFLTGLALVSRPTEDMIDHVLELCQSNPTRIAMLTLGTLLHKHCEENNCNEPDYTSSIYLAEKWLQGRLGKRCDFKSTHQAEEILIALKAIGNAGRPSSAQNTILKCAVNDNLPINMTIAALESLRRMPCRQETTEQLFNIYASHHNDVEIRVASYLALLKCPNKELLRRIAKVQRTEVNNQVGSFVWSHLTNAMESTEPVHGLPMARMVQKALGGNVLREFNLNRLRFSRAVEGSFYSDILRAGGSVQGHLIYHPNSFFPRSTHLNITMDVLGASINLFDAAARFEGFELLMEQIFGADGYIPDDRVMAMFNLKPHEERDKTERVVQTPGILRGRRSILTDDINRVESNLKSLNKKMDTRKHAPSGAVSVKVFGNEMRLASFDDISWLQSEADNINFVDFLMTLAKGGSKTFTKSMVFLDAETTVPTGLGLPLKLDVKGTSVVSVEMNGKFDIRNMFWGPMAFDVRGHLKPSAVVEIAGRMGVNAFVAEAGILVNSSLYTSTEIKGNATYKQGQILKFELGAPQKPSQIFNVSSTLFTTLNDKEVKIEGVKRRIEPTPCLNMTRVLGINVCGRLSLPVAFREYESPFYPLSGSSSFSLSVIPTDKKLRLYQIISQRLPTEDENKYDFVTKISTPNATWEREFVANASLWLLDEEKSFSISTGALGYRFGKLEGRYNNKTHAVNMTFSAADSVVLNAQFFNSTDSLKNRRMGATWSATYKNYTVRQLTELYNKSGVYGITSNTTYWPGKYLYANGEVNVQDKRFEIIANHTCTKTSICLNGSLGEEQHNIFFNFTNKPTNFSIQTTGKYNIAEKEAVLNTFVKPCRQSFTVRTSYANKGIEKGVHFRASHDNKNRVFSWYAGILNTTEEKAVKANSTIMGRPMEAIWTFFNYTSEQGVKFNGTAMGKSINTAFSYLKSENEKSLRVNASGFNKQAEAVWSYINLGSEKRLKFNASALNKTISALWSYLNTDAEKSLKFDATAMNKTINALWSYLNIENEKTLKFHASAMNKTMDAFWSYAKIDRASKLSFNATVMNKTIESALTFFNLTDEKIVKINATVLNKTVEAIWTLFNYTSEKGLRFDVNGLNKSASMVMNYITKPSDKALKINATVMNKTVEAMWSYLNRGEQRYAKFNVSAMNKTMEAVWTYFNFETEKGLKFNVAGFNKSAEVLMAFFNDSSEKGVKFNATLMKKSINATLAYFKYAENMGVRFNASCFNKTVELMSKMFTKNEEKKFVLSGSYQNYTLAMVGLFQNLTMHKSLCIHPEILGRGYGKVCATFSNKTDEKLISFNVTALNRTAEVKSQWYKKPTFCANRFTASFNSTVYVESWLNYLHTDSSKVLQMNATVAKRSMDVKFFYEKGIEQKIAGFNFTVMNKTIGMKTHLINQEKYKEVALQLMWNKNYIAKSSLRFHNLTNLKIVKFRNQIGQYTGELKGEYNLRNGRRTFFVVRMLRNGTKQLFYDKLEMSYSSLESKRRELETSYTLRVLGRTFSYGVEFAHLNHSSKTRTHHELKSSLIYSKGKRVSITNIFKNDEAEMAKNIIVEYLPGKSMSHQIVWYKPGKKVSASMEILPRIPLIHSLDWNHEEGLFVRHTASVFGKSIENYFRFIERTESYDGQLELWPKKLIRFNGQFSRKNGLLLTSTINAFHKTWTEKIDYNKAQSKLFVSVEVVPKVPGVFEASWDTAEGLKVNTKLTAFKKSLQWDGFYKRLTKTWTTDITVMKEKVTFVQSFDVNTKTLSMTAQVRDRTIGFQGRFDWKAYVASAYLTCNEHKTGWVMKMDPERRSIMYNVTLTSRISAQVSANMPSDKQIDVTFQRKLGGDVVVESQVVYELTPKASRVFVKWNTTTVKYLVGQVKSLKPIIINATSKMYNMTLFRAKNLTKEIEKMVKKFENKIKPFVMKYYQHAKAYDFKGLYKNISNIAQSMSLKTYNLTMKAYTMSFLALNKTITNLPMLVRNATILYKKIRSELNASIPLIYGNCTVHLKRIRTHLQHCKQNVTLHLMNINLHLKNISRDLKSWGLNLTQMVGEIKVRDEKLRDIAVRVIKRITLLGKELSKNMTVQLKKLHVNIRDLEIRKQKLGPLMDKYMMKIRIFTCEFNASCTLKKIGAIAMNISLKATNMTVLNKTLYEHFVVLNKTFHQRFIVLNKTIHQHFVFLKEKANNLSRELSKNITVLKHKIEVLSKKLIELAPGYAKNTTIKSIELARNLTKDIQKMTKEITRKIKLMSSQAMEKVDKYTKPLAKLIVKVSVSIYNRAKPVVMSYIESGKPFLQNLKDLKTKVIMFNQPMMKPLGPLAMDVIYQVLNLTIHKLPLGVMLDNTIKVTVEEGTKIFHVMNHTLSTNVTAVIAFINELSKKTPEQIVDLTIMKITEMVNATKKMVNDSIRHTYTNAKQAMKAYQQSIKAFNQTIFKIINMRPEDLVQVSIMKVQIFAKNMTLLIKNITAEVQNITKQLKNLDFVTPAQKAWKEMDMFNKFASLDMKAKWESIVQKVKGHIDALNVKAHALNVKSRAENYGMKIVKELREISAVAYRVYNLTVRLVRIDITREQFVNELLAVIESAKTVGRKHFHIAKNTTFGLYGLHQRYWKSATVAAYSYKSLSSAKAQEMYSNTKDYLMEFYREHEVETKEAYNFYKQIAMDVYDVVEKEASVLKGKVAVRMDNLKTKLISRVEMLVQKLRVYENMTYEEIALKVHKMTKDFGLQLYKNYSIKVIKFYNDTKNLTMRTYNLTKVMAIKYYNLSKVMAVKYYNLSKVMAVKYYNESRVHAMRIFNTTKNFTLTYYKIYKNRTISAYYMTRNMTLKALNVTRNMTIRYIKHFNSSIRPMIVVYIGKGKALALKAYNDGIQMGKRGVEKVKVWYAENKDKTVEELYNEAYTMVNTQTDKVVKKAKAEYERIVMKATSGIKKLNKTLMEIKKDVVAVYDQTKNVTIISGKQLIAIFHPYAKTAQNKTMIMIIRIRNASIPLIQKAKNFTLVNLQKAKNLTLIQIQKAKNYTFALYRNITSRQDFKNLMMKYQVKERYAKVVAKVKELIEKVKELRVKAETYVKETRPKIEAKIKKIVHYMNVTLPALMKQKRAELMAKRDEIMANPKEYAANIYATAELKARKAFNQAIENTAAEQIIRHEIWGELLDEIKQHEIIEAGKDIFDFSKDKTTKAIAIATSKAKELKAQLKIKIAELKVKAEELKQKAKDMVEKTKKSIKKGFNDFKQMKLREIVEHHYVFKTIEFTKNTSEKIKNMTIQAKNMTIKAIAIGKVFYKNMTIKAQKYVIKIKQFALTLKKNATVMIEKYRPMFNKFTLIAKNYTLVAKNMTVKYYNIARKYAEIKTNETRVFVNKTIEKAIKMYMEKVHYYKAKVETYYKTKVMPFYKNKVVPFYKNKVIPAFEKYTALADELSKNMTLRAKTYILNSRPYKFSVKTYHLTVKTLRDASKMTIRESVLLMRSRAIIAYNYTVNVTLHLKTKAINMTKMAVNMTIQKYHASKIYLTKLVNNCTAALKPWVPTINQTKNEIVETITFINKYYGVEDKVRAQVEYHYSKLQLHYNEYKKHTERMPAMLKSSAYSALEFVNKTIRYAHGHFGTLNQTMSAKMMKIRAYMTKVREHLMKLRADLPNHVQMSDGMFSLVIPHPQDFNGNIKDVCTMACNKAINLKNKVVNMTRHAINMTKTYARVYQLKAMNMTRVWKQIALNKTTILRMRVYKLSMAFYNRSMKCPFIKRHMNATIHYFNITRQFIREFNMTEIVNLTKTYAPVVYNISKEWCMVGYNASRTFTLKVSGMAWNISFDIYNSTSMKEALEKAKSHSMQAYNETLKIYRALYKHAMIRYAELRKTAEKVYQSIAEHRLTQKYIHHSKEYYRHSSKILKSRTRHLHRVKKYWHRRINHKINHISNLLRPRNWVPPFNSTAMIFGKPHVSTFDSLYYRFPGYNKPECTYVLARDVRDNKFTIMSQEDAMILITEDGNVKIHSSGRVESMVKIDAEGNKILDGYNSELPVQTKNMTVTREGPFVVLRHDIGIEILCDMEHNACTFNFDKWFHGRLAGLLGTNNNEHHDEMTKPNGKHAGSLIEFVNSWEVTNDTKCQIQRYIKPKSKCPTSRYSSRCRELFKDEHSPLAPFFNITNPRPFMLACEDDYATCDSKTAKDMKHCNTTAAYIELLRMKGEWAEFLPECGRCASHEMGNTWFQKGSKLVDVVLIVPETQGMRGFAKRLPEFVFKLQDVLRQYSFKFGLISFGGKGAVHSEPHVVTVNGQHLGDVEDVSNAIEHLKFADRADNETDGFEAISMATRYPFRTGSTKIVLLLTADERIARPGTMSVRRLTKQLKRQDIIFNVIGKYKKLNQRVIGQDYRGKVFYRKNTKGQGTGVALPEGQYIELMKNTKGSVFGLSLFASDNTKLSDAVRMASTNAWKEQIKLDQIGCKECSCVHGYVGEGRTICKINELHNKC